MHDGRVRTVVHPTVYTFLLVSSPVPRTVFAILGAITLSHLLNDLVQSLLPAIYPILKTGFHLDFWQIGLITLANQLTASLLQWLAGTRRGPPEVVGLHRVVTSGVAMDVPSMVL